MAMKTPVSILQELLSRRGITPSYELVQVEGPIDEPTFRYRVSFTNEAVGAGLSMKDAKHAAAKALLDQMTGVTVPHRSPTTSQNTAINGDAQSTTVQINTLEQALKEWRELAADYCPPNSPQNAMFLRNRIEQLLQKDVVMASEKGSSRNEKDSIPYQVEELKTQNYALNPDNQLRVRQDLLEETLPGYKEMCVTLEAEVPRLLPDIPLELPTNTESYGRLKKEIEVLRLENDRLKRRMELELEMEHGDFNVDKDMVVHMAMNPAAEAYENSKNEIEKLQVEIEHLKGIYRRLRDVVNMAFGYHILRAGNLDYRIWSIFSEGEDDFLYFRLNESGVLDMLETDYSKSLGEMMRTHLTERNSLPSFLSALTLKLFNRTTMMV